MDSVDEAVRVSTAVSYLASKPRDSTRPKVKALVMSDHS